MWGVGEGCRVWAEQKTAVAPQEEESIRDGEAYSRGFSGLAWALLPPVLL